MSLASSPLGTALVRAVATKAERICLVTSNDNVEAQRFYARLGMTLVAIHRGVIDAERVLKPAIPLVGHHGTPIADEYEFEWRPSRVLAREAAAARGERTAPAMSVRRFVADEWRLYRYLRVRALGDAPDAFSSTLEEALSRADGAWTERLAQASAERDLPLLAEVDGAAAGLAWGRIDPSDPGAAYLYQMWVTPEYRGQGVARSLLNAVVDWARARGSRELLLGVTQGNAAAVGLYGSVGFAPTGAEEPLQPGSGRVVQSMRLKLDTPVR